MQDQIAEITGIKLDLVVGELYAQVVSALYLVVPPAEMQAGTESFFENLTGYVSGELPILEPRLGFAKTLTPEVLSERIVTALQVGASEAIDKTIPILERKTGEFVEGCDAVPGPNQPGTFGPPADSSTDRFRSQPGRE